MYTIKFYVDVYTSLTLGPSIVLVYFLIPLNLYIFQLCNVFCCYPPATMIPGEHSSAMRLYLPWMAPELMHTRISNFVS